MVAVRINLDRLPYGHGLGRFFETVLWDGSLERCGVRAMAERDGKRVVLASQQMALVDLTKQLAKEAFLSATQDPAPAAPALPAADNVGAIVMGQIHSMQTRLKEDEELVIWFSTSTETLRVMEIFLPSPKLAVLSGHDTDHNLTRVISPVEALQLVAKVMKVAAGSKPVRVGLVMPKAKDSTA